MTRPQEDSSKLSPVELERIVPLTEAARLRGVSVDTLRRHYPHLIVDLSPRRRGMKLRHALGMESAA